MCTVAEICSTGVRVTLSDVPEVLLTATNSEPPVQDAGLAAKAGTLCGTASDFGPVPFFFASVVLDVSSASQWSHWRFSTLQLSRASSNL